MKQTTLDFIREKTLELCRIPSPTGMSHQAVDFVAQEFTRLGVEISHTRKGALLATLPGRDQTNHRALAAHVDTLGAMVREVKSSGRLRLTRIGGYSGQTIEGEQILVHTQTGRTISGTVLVSNASTHVHGSAHDKQERTEETLEIRLDERVQTRAETLALGVQVGDYISLDPRTELTASGFIKSRHLDDKACVAILLGLAKEVIEQRIPLAATTHLFISNYEEVGHGAAFGIPPEVVEVVALDMAAVGEGQTSDEYSVTVCMKDSSGPYDYDLSRRLQSIAATAGISCRMDIYPFYASDASAALRAGGGFRAALVGPGIDASHSYERCHVDSLRETARLMLQYLLQ
jgi:putative aminopeptidase FrvX